MHILLAAATAAEIQPTIDFLLRTSPTHFAAAIFDPGCGVPIAHPAKSGDTCQVSVNVTGIGSVATTWSLMRCLGTLHPDLAIQGGIAGCLTGRATGETLAINDDSLADLGVWEDERFKSPFDLQLIDPNDAPFSAGHLPNPYARLLDLTGLEAVKAITVNEISTDPNRVQWLQANTGAVVESMEGAAFHYVCLRERIPFIQLRSVSNAVGIRDKSKWDIPAAIRDLNHQLTGLLEKLACADDYISQPHKGIPS